MEPDTATQAAHMMSVTKLVECRCLTCKRSRLVRMRSRKLKIIVRSEGKEWKILKTIVRNAKQKMKHTAGKLM